MEIYNVSAACNRKLQIFSFRQVIYNLHGVL